MREARNKVTTYHSMLAPSQLGARGSGKDEGCCRCLRAKKCGDEARNSPAQVPRRSAKARPKRFHFTL
jgi:hypothetical protein